MSVAFVLGGGGRWGAVEVGMLAALTEVGITPDTIVGTSIGAVNGAMFAAEPTPSGIERLEQAWRDLAARRVGAAQAGPVPESRPLAPRRSSATVRSNAGSALICRSTASTIWQPRSSASPRRSSAPRRPGSARAARAGTAGVGIDSGVFPPVEIDGEHFYDGGLVNSVPISRAIELGATTIYVLQVGRVEQQLTVPKRWYEAGIVAFEISRRHRSPRSTRACRTTSTSTSSRADTRLPRTIDANSNGATSPTAMS